MRIVPPYALAQDGQRPVLQPEAMAISRKNFTEDVYIMHPFGMSQCSVLLFPSRNTQYGTHAIGLALYLHNVTTIVSP